MIYNQCVNRRKATEDNLGICVLPGTRRDSLSMTTTPRNEVFRGAFIDLNK